MIGSYPDSPEYYSIVRTEILSLLPPKNPRVLDVGCGYGSTGAYLLKNGMAETVSGVEFLPQAAAEARKVLTKVWNLDLNRDELPPDLQREKFDLILCLDVLEHLVDPWLTLRRLSDLLPKGGRVLVSVPNLRHWKTVFSLVVRGDFSYTNHGTLDSGHLRFFTKKTALSLVAGAGFEIEKISQTGRAPGQRSWWLDKLTLGLFREFLDFQYLICAVKK